MKRARSLPASSENSRASNTDLLEGLRHAQGVEHEPRHFSARALPDPQGMAEASRAAETIVTYAALGFLDYLGADIPSLMAEAQLAYVIPLKGGEHAAVRARLASDPPGEARRDGRGATSEYIGDSYVRIASSSGVQPLGSWLVG